MISWTLRFLEDGSRLGWFAVLGLFSTWMIWIGIVQALAVMLPTLQEQFNAATWLVGWMIAIIDAAVEFSGVFASPLREKFGARAVVTVSGVLVGGSMIASSFASSLYQIAIILTLFAAPAVGVCNISTKEVIGRCFSESFSKAYGLAGIGSSLAVICWVPLTQFFLDVFGWRGTMMLLGGIFSHLAVCGALMKQPTASGVNVKYRTVTSAEDEEPRVSCDDDASLTGRCFQGIRSVYKDFRQTFQVSVVSTTPFWLVAFMLNIWMIMYTAWSIYFIPYSTVSKTFPPGETSSFVASYGVGRIVGNVMIGPPVQKDGAFGNYTWLGICLFMLSIYYILDPWLVSYWPVLVNAFVYGYFNSFALIIFDIIIIDIFGVNQMGIVLGWIGLIAGVSRLCFLYFPGLIYDFFGSYTIAFTLMGGVHCLTVVALLALVWLRRRRPSIL